MKKKLPKKILAAFLAVMMVATSIPFSAVTAFAATGYVDAATDEKVIAVENAMDAFKSKLSEEGKSYSNVSPAYAAYVNCQQGLDAYIYGGEENALDGLADTLNAAVNNMQEFDGIEANTDRYRTVQIYSADSTGYSAEEYAQTYSNLLWSETGINTDNNDGKQASDDGYAAVTLFYPEVTLMYDGKTDPVTSMMAVASGEGSWTWGGSDRYISAITMENSSDTGFAFNQNWHGTSGSNLDFNWSWITNGKDNNDQYNLSYNTTDAGSVYQIRKGGTVAVCKNYTKFFANRVVFTDGAEKFSDNRWKIDVQPQVKGHIGSSSDYIQNIDNGSSVIVNGSTYIHVVNYKQIIDNVKSAGEKMKTADLADYTQGGLTDYFTSMDAATSFDPNTYFTESNNIDGYCSAASDIVKNVKRAKTTDTNASVASGFQAIRDAMGSQLRQTYAGGGDKYTADTWQAFVTAYEAARDEMAATNDTKLSTDLSNVKNIYYYNSQAKDYTTTVAKALLDAYNALKTNVAKVDTSALVAYINQFQSYQPDFFTEETYNAASQAVKEIKTDVWGSEEMWGVPANAPDDDAEGVGKAKVTAAVEKYKAAFAALRISSAGVVLTTQGRYSLDEAIALESKIADPSDYSNYADFATVLAEAKTYKSKLASTEMTDYDTQYDEYTNTVDALVKAYNGLLYSFTKIPDGTVYGNTESDNIARMTIKDQGSTFVEGSYTNQGIVFRTDHNAKQVKFGDFNVTFGTTTNSYRDNALDSISINATAPKLGDNGSKAHITSQGGIGTIKPKGLSDEQKATYAGCLSYSNKNDDDKPFTFSVSNLKYTGRNGSNVSEILITKNDGTQIKDHATAIQTPLDEILGTTNGQEVTPMVGGVFAQSDGNDDEAYSYIKGDFNIDIPATEKQTLTRDTVPTLSTFEMQTRFGAVASWKCQNATIFSGYNWLTSEMTDTYLTPAVKVIDISSLVELVAECNALTADSQKYTDESWAKFTAALKNAQNNINYNNMTSSDSVNTLVNTILKSRYQTLWDARANLVVKTLTVNVKYGKDLTSLDPAIKVTYGEKISAADIARINAILKETYEADGYTWIPNGFTTTFDPEAAVTEDIDLTVKYDKGDALPASWDAYDSAKAALIAKLEGTDKFAYDALTNVKNELAKLSFFTLADNEKTAYTSESQSAIDAETATITSLTNSLTAISLTSDVLQVAAAAQAAQGKDDTDMYDNVATKIDYKGDVTFDMITKGASSDTLTVTGYKYSTDSALEAAIKAALNGLELKTYDIYVNDTKIGTVAYGTPISVTPTKIISTTDTTVKGDGANYSWTYSYTAPSRDPNFGTASQDNKTYLSAEKYMLTAPSLGFIVKGETHLTATQVSTGKTGYTVTFKSNVNGKIINVINTDASGNFTMPVAPSVPYYTFDSYSNGVAANTDANVSQDTVITVNYTADEENLYTFYVYNNPDDFLGTAPAEVWDTVNSLGVEKAHDSVAYNELVNVNIPDAYAIAKAVYDEDSGEYWYYILAYGDTYSFYAHESIGDDTLYAGIVGITEEQYKKMQEPNNGVGYVYGTDGERIVAQQNTLTGDYITKDLEFEVYNRESPVFAADNSKFSLIGTFICPTGYEMVETGFLMTKGASSLTVENAADKSKGVSRFKASKYTVGNQFVINIKTPSSEQSFKYVAYAKYKDKSGNIVTKYGKVVSATTANS